MRRVVFAVWILWVALHGTFQGTLQSAFAQAQAQDPVSIAWVQERVSDGRIRSIEQLLEHLPREYRSEFTLIYQSQSRQAATLKDPRVIFYGPQGTFLLAVNGGDRGVPGAHVAEMIQFNSVERKFEFFELEERAGGEGEGQNGSVTLKRGVGCTDCHRMDPRPNWQPYHQWPGAFGGDDDQLTPNEMSMIAQLKQRAPTHPRYRALEGLDGRYADHLNRQDSVPNIRFTQRISQLNFQRIIRLIQATPDYDQFKYSILGTLVCIAADPYFFLPPLLRADDPNEVSGDPGVRGKSAFIRLFEKRGISTLDWTMAFLPSSQAAVADPTYVVNEYRTPGFPNLELPGALVSQDLDLQRFATGVPYVYENAPSYWATEVQCRALKQAADVALTGHWTSP